MVVVGGEVGAGEEGGRPGTHTPSGHGNGTKVLNPDDPEQKQLLHLCMYYNSIIITVHRTYLPIH